ncbi:MAG: AbrB/MazE/SpoVT family DNA-binding domain-containing protein [Candidatus Woesearchaeota archaeon]
MKKFAKIIQTDLRGQVVIPKEVRQELNIEGGTGFYLYTIENEGILLKIIPQKELHEQSHIIKEIEINADKISVKKENIEKSVQNYKRTGKGNFQNIT